MSQRVSAAMKVEGGNLGTIMVREYNEENDKEAVEEMERLCEIGQGGKSTLVTDLMGDPLCRVRHFPSHIMLVAEYGEEGKLVGVVRGCVKTVTRGNLVFVKVAYLLGLRVSPKHRNLGVGTMLVKKVEEWSKQNGADYAYMATDCSNHPSIHLFTTKCAYRKFRTPTMLVQPIHAHRIPLDSAIAIVRLTPSLAESVYRRVFADSAEFFPKDIDSVLGSHHSLGTFMAVPKKCLPMWDPKNNAGALPPSYAVLSVWSIKQVFRLQVKGVSPVTRAVCAASRLVDSRLPWLKLPSFPDVFRKFWVYFVYGLHMEGKNAARFMRCLCNFVHNMGMEDDGCGAMVAEVGPRDPVRTAIPHWRKLSFAEDLWCLKKLRDSDGERSCEPSDWTKSSPSSSVVFVDPRDI